VRIASYSSVKNYALLKLSKGDGQQGIAYAKTVAEAMNLKVGMDDPAACEKLRRAILDLVAGRKMRKQKGA